MEWNTKRIDEILPQFSALIKSIHPSKTNAEDKHIWKPLASGTYSTKSGYYSLAAQNTEETITDQDFSWIKDVWSGEFSPKMRVFLWYVSNLQTRVINSDALCVRCK